MQKKVNIARPEIAVIERSICKGGLWLASGNLTEKEFPTLIRRPFLNGKGGSMCLDCANNTLYVEKLLSFWESGIVVHAR